MAQEELKVVVKVVLDEAKQKMSQFSKAIQGLKQDYLNIRFAAVDFYNVLKKVGTVVWSFVDESMKAEDAIKQLGAAMISSGQDSVLMTKQLAGLSRALSMTSTFGEEETMSAMQQLTQIGRVSAEGMKKAIPVVHDLAAALGMDLNSAAMLVGKAMEGNTAALGRYGIKIKETSDPAERFSAVIAGLTGRFGGMSEAMAASASGGLKQIRNEFEELKEAVGNRLLQSFKSTIFGLASLMKSNVIMATSVSDVGSVEEATAYVKVLQRELDRLKEQKKTNPDVVMGPFGAGINTVTEQDKRIQAVKDKIEGLRRAMINMSRQAVQMPDLLPGVSGDDGEKTKATLTVVNSETEKLAKTIASMQDSKVDWPMEWAQYCMDIADAQEATEDFNQELWDMKDAMDQLQAQGVMPVGDEFLSTWEQMRAANESFKSSIESIAPTLEDLQKSLGDMAEKLASDAFLGVFDALGASLANGSDAASSMGEALREAVQDFMDQLPRLLFQAGIMQLAQGNTPLGLGLIAASGITALMGGAMRGATGAAGEGSEQVNTGTGTGATTIIVQGNVVTERDLAWRQQMLENRW